MNWEYDLIEAPRDGRMVLLLMEWVFSGVTEWTVAACSWRVDDDGTVFGWTFDGGDRFDPVAWCAITGPDGEPIYK